MSLENCWEISKCTKNSKKECKKLCPAGSGSRGHTCWMVTNTLCGGNANRTFAQKKEICLECEVYKRYNPHLGTKRNQVIKEYPAEFAKGLEATPEYLSEKTLWIAATWNRDVLKVFNQPLTKTVKIHLKELLKVNKTSSAKVQTKEVISSKFAFMRNSDSDVRTPLNGIINLADRTLNTELTPEQRENLTKLKVTANHLLSTINGFFQEQGKFILKSTSLFYLIFSLTS